MFTIKKLEREQAVLTSILLSNSIMSNWITEQEHLGMLIKKKDLLKIFMEKQCIFDKFYFIHDYRDEMCENHSARYEADKERTKQLFETTAVPLIHPTQHKYLILYL